MHANNGSRYRFYFAVRWFFFAGVYLGLVMNARQLFVIYYRMIYALLCVFIVDRERYGYTRELLQLVGYVITEAAEVNELLNASHCTAIDIFELSLRDIYLLLFTSRLDLADQLQKAGPSI